LRPMPRPEGLGTAGAISRPGMFNAGMEFAKSGAGMGSAIGGMLPGMLMPPKAPDIPASTEDAEPDLMQQRAMPRELQMPGPDYRPGFSGEFDYGLSAPYTTEYMQKYAPRRMNVGGVVGNPYAERYAEQRGEMLAPVVPQMGAPMRMAEGGGVERDYGFQVQQGGSTPRRSAFNTTKGGIGSLGQFPFQDRMSMFASRKGSPQQQEAIQQVIQDRPELVEAIVRPRATPTPTRTTSASLAEELERNPIRMAMGGQVQRMVPGYGPVAMQAGGIAEIGAEPMTGGAQPNEREVISAAVAAIQGQHPQPEVALGMFLQQFGEEALRDLVDRVQSGELGDTAARSEGQLNGPGDGMNDMIPASIEGQQDVLLSDGEYVVPADVVSHLGNGSTDAGARELDKMAERARKARTGTGKQAPAVPQERMLPV
jgi:hypothetical protein